MEWIKRLTLRIGAKNVMWNTRNFLDLSMERERDVATALQGDDPERAIEVVLSNTTWRRKMAKTLELLVHDIETCAIPQPMIFEDIVMPMTMWRVRDLPEAGHVDAGLSTLIAGYQRRSPPIDAWDLWSGFWQSYRDRLPPEMRSQLLHEVRADHVAAKLPKTHKLL